jgi:hypothetical protein
MQRLDEDNKAWQILTEEEKTALTLQLAYDKSTWQAGEVMGKAHYKYLEIKQRGEKFLKIFTEHFEIFENLVPAGVNIDPRFKKYLELVILKRKLTHEAIEKINDKDFSSSSFRDNLIIQEFNKLQNKEKYSHTALLNIILDFDRWNNFRILPKELQEPSGFKRRNKNRLKKQIKVIVNLSEFVIEKVIERFQTKEEGKHILYLPIILEKGNYYKIIKVNSNKENHIEQISKLGLFIFQNLESATEFAELVVSFDINSKKHCKQGLTFWPQYRLLIQGAINHNKIENIIPTRKYLDNLLNSWDLNMVRSIKKAKSPEN